MWDCVPLFGVVAVLGALAAVCSAAYTGFLFGQAEGRDFWQSPLLAPHLVVQPGAAGLPHPDNRYADVSVDTARAHAIYREWLARARPAPGPGGLRPYKPDPSAYRVPETVEPEGR